MRETRLAVVVSEEQGEVDKFRKWGLDITPHRKLIKEGFGTEDGRRIDIETAFKKDGHPFRVAIVSAPCGLQASTSRALQRCIWISRSKRIR